MGVALTVNANFIIFLKLCGAATLFSAVGIILYMVSDKFID